MSWGVGIDFDLLILLFYAWVMTTQTLLKNINIQIKKERSPLVVLSLNQWQQIEDIISELSSPQLLESIREARKDYKKAKTYRELRKSLLK
ncbi:MAG: hypothetical protein A2939_04910 [Parcubacteria group bacterium RIFCSPLOWO2_01_FULL_48_18]|nr:MAG: hypothetical protein A2939_04910 [Parcubacteria group bacterium RIFCSPLOWO2_01_FULL_48_18]